MSAVSSKRGAGTNDSHDGQENESKGFVTEHHNKKSTIWKLCFAGLLSRKIPWHVRAIACAAFVVSLALVLLAFREDPFISTPSLPTPSLPSDAQSDADKAAVTTSFRSGWFSRREETAQASSSASAAATATATATAAAAAAPPPPPAPAPAPAPATAPAAAGAPAEAQTPLGTTPTAAALAPGPASTGRNLGESEPPAAAAPPPASLVKPPEYGSIRMKDVAEVVTANEKTCFQVRVMDAEGRPFDRQSGEREEGQETRRKGVDWRVEPSQGHLHRAFLVARAVYDKKLPLGADVGGGDGGRGWEDGNPEEEVSTVFAPRVRFLRLSGLHEVCYAPPRPGRLVLELTLLFTNTYELVSSVDPTHPEGYAGPRTVLTLNVTVHAPASGDPEASDHLPLDADRWLSNRRSLPWCTLPILDRSQGEGFWEGILWHPARCRVLRPSIDSLLSCLNGRNVLFLGDSQVRAVFGFMLGYLAFQSRGDFFKKMGKEGWENTDIFNSMKEVQVNGHTEQQGSGSAEKDRQVRRVEMHVNGSVWGAEIGEQGRPFDAVLCSLSSNGSAMAHIKTRVGQTVVSFNLTFVRHEDHRMPVVPHWATLRSECGGSRGPGAAPEERGEGDEGSDEGQRDGRNGAGEGQQVKAEASGASGPFDFAVVARQLHDVQRFELAEEYAGWLASRFEPEMRGLVRGGGMGRVLLLGGPASQEGEKNGEGEVPPTNRARQFAFECAAERAILGQDPTEDELWGFRHEERDVNAVQDKGRLERERCKLAQEGGNESDSAHFLRVGPLSAPRPDFCTNGLHYAWPVDLAVLDLLFGSICCGSK